MRRRKWLTPKITDSGREVTPRAERRSQMAGVWKRRKPTAMPDQLREERLSEEDVYQRILPLKNGAGKMRIAVARCAQEELWLVLRHEPELFAALHALVEGRSDGVSQEQRKALEEGRLLTRDGAVRSDLRAIMKAGYHETPAGPIIIEPFDLTNPEHAAIAQRADDEFQQSLDRSRPRMQMFLADLKAKARNQNKGGNRSL